MICSKKILNLFLLFALFTTLGCTQYKNISKTERVLSYKLLSNEKINYVEKFDKKTNQWFKAICVDRLIVNIEDCADNFQFTKHSLSKIESLLQGDGKKNNIESSNQQQPNNNENQEESFGEGDLGDEEEFDEEGFDDEGFWEEGFDGDLGDE